MLPFRVNQQFHSRQPRNSCPIRALPLPSRFSLSTFNCRLSTSGSSYPPFPLSHFLSTASELFSRLLHTTAPASLLFSATYKLFAVTTGVAYDGTPSKSFNMIEKSDFAPASPLFVTHLPRGEPRDAKTAGLYLNSSHSGLPRAVCAKGSPRSAVEGNSPAHRHEQNMPHFTVQFRYGCATHCAGY